MNRFGFPINFFILIYLIGDPFITFSFNFNIQADDYENLSEKNGQQTYDLLNSISNNRILDDTGCLIQGSNKVCAPNEICVPVKLVGGVCYDSQEYQNLLEGGLPLLDGGAGVPNQAPPSSLYEDYLDQRQIRTAKNSPQPGLEPDGYYEPTGPAEVSGTLDYDGSQADADGLGGDYQDDTHDYVDKRGHQRYSDTDFQPGQYPYRYGGGQESSLSINSPYQVQVLDIPVQDPEILNYPPSVQSPAPAHQEPDDASDDDSYEPVQFYYEPLEEMSSDSAETDSRRIRNEKRRSQETGFRNFVNDFGKALNQRLNPVYTSLGDEPDYTYSGRKYDGDTLPKRYDEPKKGNTITEDYSAIDDNRFPADYPAEADDNYDNGRDIYDTTKTSKDAWIPLSHTASGPGARILGRHPLHIPTNELNVAEPPDHNKDYAFIKSDYAFIRTKQNITDQSVGLKMLAELAKKLKVPLDTFSHVQFRGTDIIFKVNPNLKSLNASLVAYYTHLLKTQLESTVGIEIVASGIGSDIKLVTTKARRDGEARPDYDDGETVALIRAIDPRDPRGKFLALAACLAILMLILALLLVYIFRSRGFGLFGDKKKSAKGDDSPIYGGGDSGVRNESGEGYHTAANGQSGAHRGILATFFGKRGPSTLDKVVTKERTKDIEAGKNGNGTQGSAGSNRSSTSSWSEEKALTKMDVTTGHVVLAYMEKHIVNRNLIDQEWEACQNYVPVPLDGIVVGSRDSTTTVTADPSSQENYLMNLYLTDHVFDNEARAKALNPWSVLPYPSNRVKLKSVSGGSGGGGLANESGFINASYVTEHDPRYPSYIAAQSPMKATLADFWRMVWENGICIIVNLTRPEEVKSQNMEKYWPDQGLEIYSVYEVHLVSEHMWCEDYIVRSFYLKNLQTNETRTLTQFHYLAWPDRSIPRSTKSLLDFRRKVNKSYKGRSTPIIVHDSDGCGRTGTYILIDMILSRLTKGVKEIDIAASVEHLRDQRMTMVSTKEQFEFAFLAVSEEVQAILKALTGSTATPPNQSPPNRHT